MDLIKQKRIKKELSKLKKVYKDIPKIDDYCRWINK